MEKTEYPSVQSISKEAESLHIKVLHTNIQCIANKIPNLELHLQTEKPDLVCISEHWLKEPQALATTIEGYSIITKHCRTTGIHGGVAIYGSNKIGAQKLKHINVKSVDFTCEVCAASLKTAYSKIAIVCAYRSPTAPVDSFLHIMNDVLLWVNKSCQFIILCGDFNIDYLQTNKVSSLLLDLFASFEVINTLPV